MWPKKTRTGNKSAPIGTVYVNKGIIGNFGTNLWQEKKGNKYEAQKFPPKKVFVDISC